MLDYAGLLASWLALSTAFHSLQSHTELAVYVATEQNL